MKFVLLELCTNKRGEGRKEAAEDWRRDKDAHSRRNTQNHCSALKAKVVHQVDCFKVYAPFAAISILQAQAKHGRDDTTDDTEDV